MKTSTVFSVRWKILVGLSSVMIPVVGYFATTVIGYGQDITALKHDQVNTEKVIETERINTTESLKDIREDVKYIRRLLDRQAYNNNKERDNVP